MAVKKPVTVQSRPDNITSKTIRKYPVTELQSSFDSPGDLDEYSFKEIWERFCQHEKSVSDINDPEIKRRQRMFIPSEFRDKNGGRASKRDRARFYQSKMCVIDIDTNGKQLFEALNAQDPDAESILFGWLYLGYTSANFGLPDYPEEKQYRLRLIFPFGRTVYKADEYRRVVRAISNKLVSKFGCEVDPSSEKVTQAFTFGIFNPASQFAPRNWKHNGKRINVDEMLVLVPDESKPKKAKLPFLSSNALTSDSELDEVAHALKYIGDVEGKDHDIRQFRLKILRCLFGNFDAACESVARDWYPGNNFDREWDGVQRTNWKNQFETTYIFAIARKNPDYRPLKTLRSLTTKRDLVEYIGNKEKQDAGMKENPDYKTIVKDIISANSKPKKVDYQLAKFYGTGDEHYDLAFLRVAMKNKFDLSELRSMQFASAAVQTELTDWFEMRKQAALDSIRIPWDERTIVQENCFNPDLPIQAIVSDYGTQKTRKIVTAAVDWAHENGYGSLILNERMYAVKAICDTINAIGRNSDKDWKVEFYEHVKERKNPGNVNRLACCLPSIAHQAFHNLMQKPLVVIIDEVAQVLSSLVYGQYLKSEKSHGASVAQVTLTLRRILQNAVRIVIMDANCTMFHLDLLKMILDRDVEIPIFSTPPVPLDRRVEYGFNVGGNRDYQDVVMAEVFRCIENGEKCAIPVESKDHAYRLKDLIERLASDVKIAVITGEKSEEKSALFKSKSVNDFFSQYDVVIHTSAISAAVSVELPEYTTVCGFFGGYALTPTYILQMIARLRKANRVFLSLDIHGHRQPDIVSHIYRESDDVLGIELHKTVIEKICAHRVQEMACPLHTVLWYLQERDAHVQALEINNADGYLDDLKDERNDNRKKYDNAIINATPLSEDDYKRSGREEYYLPHAEIERYRICHIFKIKMNESVTLQHLYLCRKDRTLRKKFMVRACLLYLNENGDNPVKGRLPDGSDSIFRVLKPVRELCKNMSDSLIKQLQRAIRTGIWLDIDEAALCKAVLASARFLKEQVATAMLIPHDLNTLQRSRLTDAQQHAIIVKFKRVFLPDEKDAALCLEATKRYMEPLQNEQSDYLGPIKSVNPESKRIVLQF